MTREPEQPMFYPEDDLVPMKSRLFDLAAAEVQSHRDAPELQAAVRAVLIDGMKVVEAAEKFGVPQPNISRRAARIQEQLQVIAQREGWVLETFLLPASLASAVGEFEASTITPLQHKHENKKKTSRRTAK